MVTELGRIELTPIPNSPRPSAEMFVRPWAPRLAVEYAARCLYPTKPAIDEMLMIDAVECFFNSSVAVFTPQNVPVRSMSMARSQSAISASMTDPEL